MPTPTLAMDFDELSSKLGRHLGYGRDPRIWTSEQALDVEELVNSGYAQFLNPPPIAGRTHNWTFLEQVRTLTLTANIPDYDLPRDVMTVEGPLTLAGSSTTVDAREYDVQLFDYSTGNIHQLNTVNDLASGVLSSRIVLSTGLNGSGSSHPHVLGMNYSDGYYVGFPETTLGNDWVFSRWPSGGVVETSTPVYIASTVQAEFKKYSSTSSGIAFTQSDLKQVSDLTDHTVGWFIGTKANVTHLMRVEFTHSRFDVGAGIGWVHGVWAANPVLESASGSGANLYSGLSALPDGRLIAVETRVNELVTFWPSVSPKKIVTTTLADLTAYTPSTKGFISVYDDFGVLCTNDNLYWFPTATGALTLIGALPSALSSNRVSGGHILSATTKNVPVETGTSGYGDILLVNEGRIRSLRNRTGGKASLTCSPSLAAIRAKSQGALIADHEVFEIIFHPTPDAPYNVNYRCTIQPSKLSSTNRYPLGGAQHSETIMASCLAAAELAMDDRRGPYWENFMERLSASVMRDRYAIVPETAGKMVDGSDYIATGLNYHDQDRNRVYITTGGVTYPS